MVVRDKVGRKRYILFFNEGKSKGEVIKAIKGAYLAYHSKIFSIVRCKHTEKDKMIEFLNKAGFKTVKTAGTIKKLKKYINNFSQGGAT